MDSEIRVWHSQYNGCQSWEGTSSHLSAYPPGMSSKRHLRRRVHCKRFDHSPRSRENQITYGGTSHRSTKTFVTLPLTMALDRTRIMEEFIAFLPFVIDHLCRELLLVTHRHTHLGDESQIRLPVTPFCGTDLRTDSRDSFPHSADINLK